MTDTNAKILWEPSQKRIRESNMIAFIDVVNSDWETKIDDFCELYAFSVREPEKFWRSLARFAGVVAETWGNDVWKDARSHLVPSCKT